jgi:transposase
MSQERLGVMKIGEILRLQAEGLRQRDIAVSVGCARSTVQLCLRRAQAAGIGWPLPEGLDEAALHERLYPAKRTKDDPRPPPDFKRVMSELSRKHVTRRQLWREYRAQHPDGLQYTAFCENFRKWRKTLGAEATLTLEHKPGERLYVDYSGDPAYYVDRGTGEMIPGQLFVAAWGFSHKIYAEATASQTTRDWITAHVNALEAYGCVPYVFTPDNTKTAILKACYYDPEKNPEYADFARHYNGTILPTRKQKPRDKAKVENAVQLAQRRVLAALRDAVFFSLTDLNAAIRKIVGEVNGEPFQKRPGTRNQLFELYDRPAAQPLPARRYEYADIYKALVHPDYHIQVDKGLYSVHHKLIGEEVRARVGEHLVEIFLKGTLIAAHQRVARAWERRTLPEHRPPEHRAYLELGYDKMMERARAVGPRTADVLAKLALSKKHLDEVIRGALGILRLADDFTPASLENACTIALHFGAYNYRAVRDLLVESLNKGTKKTPRSATADLFHENVRGASYYSAKNQH